MQKFWALLLTLSLLVSPVSVWAQAGTDSTAVCAITQGSQLNDDFIMLAGTTRQIQLLKNWKVSGSKSCWLIADFVLSNDSIILQAFNATFTNENCQYTEISLHCEVWMSPGTEGQELWVSLLAHEAFGVSASFNESASGRNWSASGYVIEKQDHYAMLPIASVPSVAISAMITTSVVITP